MTINVLLLFLTAPWVGLQCAIVVFPNRTHLLFHLNKENSFDIEAHFLNIDFSIIDTR